MHQGIECLGDAAGRIVEHGGVQLFKVPACCRREDVLGGSLGKNLHGDRVAVRITQSLLEARFVVREIAQSGRPEKFRTIDLVNIVCRCPASNT